MNVKLKKLFILTLIIILMVGGYYFLARTDSKILPAGFFSDIIFTIPGRRPPEGSREYLSERYGFSLFYPREMSVSEFDEGGGASSFVFEDTQNAQGFQIFVLPYLEKQVSEERFLRDVPSGVREDPKGFSINGISATSFYSKSLELGDTWEIWFIREGYLYEITTFRGLETWLGDILSTWQFIP